jgi:glycosyltransferase involved in cell wall biosynthesis
MQPLVTIAIPTYQRLNYLKIAVDSALAQTYPNIEIIISQDPTKDGLDPNIQIWSQDLADRHKNVFYQSNNRNLGLAGNWNAVADAAKGDYVVIIGDDDFLLPLFVETLMNAIQPEVSVIFSNHYIIDTMGNRLVEFSHEWTQNYHRDLMPVGLLVNPDSWVWQNSIPMLSAIVKTKTIQRLRFKEDLNTPEIELFLRIAQEGGNFIFVPEYLAEYRVHSQSATNTGRGLRTDRLANYLVPFPVQASAERHKRAFLSQMIVNAVSQCLLDGKKIQAQEWIKSSYYPEKQRSQLSGIFQYLCTILPDNIGTKIYKQLYSVKQKSR